MKVPIPNPFDYEAGADLDPGSVPDPNRGLVPGHLGNPTEGREGFRGGGLEFKSHGNEESLID
jgi:hypothetical protein